MTNEKPRSPADPRPGQKPAFISSRCPRCGRELVLADRLEGETTSDTVWHDEWTCPSCRDRIYLDAPAATS